MIVPLAAITASILALVVLASLALYGSHPAVRVANLLFLIACEVMLVDAWVRWVAP